MAERNASILSEPRHGNRPMASDGVSAVRVLVVDDEPAARKLLAIVLGPPAFLCTTTGSCEGALVCLENETFDAVISDLNMTGAGGMELLKEVRVRYPHLAFLITTGVDDVEVGLDAIRQGADDYLVKPLRESAVLASLARALHERELERQVENYRHNLEQMVAERTLQLSGALQQIERGYQETLQALGAAIDLRDHETGGHSRRVCLFSLEIARKIGWLDRQLSSLASGAYLHDIGKLGIPDSILLKPGPLTDEERKMMQRHPRLGYELVKPIALLADAAEIVLMHHERFDGDGYPNGLRGDEIPLGARIFAVADSLDAITSDRPYRRASGFASARTAISHCSGTQFDPEIVSVFLDIPESVWRSIALGEKNGTNWPSESF